MSCDEGMVLNLPNRPHSKNPILGNQKRNKLYYTVITLLHTLEFATFSISRALLPHLETVMRGPEAWSRSETIRRSIEIE